jgi:amino acid adenylation domain-containing protein/non-ribosomal peptide synthase protein (TIGR01720 family)
VPTFNALDSDTLAVIDLLLENEGLSTERPRTIARRPADAPMRLSFSQRRLWFMQQVDPASPAYNIVTAVRVRGPLDVPALEASFGEIVRRHEALRTTFRSGGDGPVAQLIHHLHLPIRLLDWAAMRPDAAEAKLGEVLQAQAAAPFDLATSPLARVTVVRLNPAEHVIALVMHHIVSDGWSMGVLVRELGELYAAMRDRLPSPLAELPIQYGDYAHWQWEQRDRWPSSLDFWRRQLAGAPQIAVVTDQPRKPQPGFAGAVHAFDIQPGLLQKLKALGASERATLFMTLLAAFQLLLARYAGRTDVVVGAPVAGRSCSELKPLIGCFVNTVALRTRWPAESSFGDLLRHARTTALHAYENDEVPFDEVVRNLLPGREGTHNPLFQVMFNVETEMTAALALSFGEAVAVREQVAAPIAKFDLTLSLAPSNGGLAGGFEYRTELFDSATIARMATHYLRLLEAAVGDPQATAAHLAMLSDAERQRLTDDFNGTDAIIPEAALGRLFEQQALATPDAVAIEFAGQERSYAELRRDAGIWAGELRRRGIGLEDRVAICLPPCLEMVTAVLAVVEVGAAYVPLNPSYPDQRIAFMLRDVAARAVITQRALATRFAGCVGQVLCIDEAAADSEPESQPVPVGPDHVAYIIYTSGSTGEPKGIAVTHRAVTRLVRNTNYINLRPDDRMALASNFAFDAATFEIWGALLNGASLVGVPREIALAPKQFAGLLRERRITTLFLTTALFNQIVRHESRAFEGLRHLLFGGEMVDAQVVRTLLATAPPARLLHVYGPTECTTFATWHEVCAASEGDCTVPIGRPLSNTSAYVLDQQMELVPLGLAGELYLGGPGLARGYVNRPGLTAATFLPDPFSATPGGRLYRTGDLVRWRKEGALEYLGRVDEQVKIRGFRIEPAEIATVLKSKAGVADCVVIALEDAPDRRRLAAYVVMERDAAFSPAALREHVASLLPDYMVPSVFVPVAHMPLNANGKLDRRALPIPVESVAEGLEDASPRDDRERVIAEVWRDVLRLERVGIRRNYFELGGDSITAIQIVSRLQRDGWEIAVRDLFEHPTVEGLAPRLRRAASAATRVEPLLPAAPLSQVQRWFFDFHRGPVHHFNQSVLVQSREPIDVDRLRMALDALADRHDALRTAFPQVGSERSQVITGMRPALSVFDLRGQDPSLLEGHGAMAQGACDLARGPLLRAVIFRCDEADRLLLVAHHLVVDGISWRIVLDELQLACRQLATGMSIDLGPQPMSWQRWVLAQHRQVRDDALLAQLPYWRETAEAARSGHFPRDGETADNFFRDSQALSFALSEAETRALLEAAVGAFHSEANDLLLTAFARALAGWAGLRSCVITLESHGRDALGASVNAGGTVGWFTSLFPFHLVLADGEIREQLLQIKQALRRVPQGGAGYGVLRHLAMAEGLDYPAVLSFNYLGRFDVGSSAGDWELAAEETGTPFAPELPRQHDLDLTAIVLAGRLNVSIMYHAGRHRRARIAALLAAYQTELVVLSDYCRGRTPERAAADFACGDLSQTKWDALCKRCGWVPSEVEDVHHATPMQAGLLFHSLYDSRSRAYHLQMVFELEGAWELKALSEAWNDLTLRHAALRTAFIPDSGEQPWQVILRERTSPIAVIDLTGLAASEQAAALGRRRAEELERGFDLARDPLSRLTLLRLAPERACLIWSYHHALLDGWSLGILSHEFIELYRARANASVPALAPAFPYPEYLRWMAARDATASGEYWRKYLLDLACVTSVPRLAGTPPAGPEAAAYFTELDAELTLGLRELAAESNATLNHVVQALWALLLVRYNGTPEAVFGTIVSGRPAELPGAENAVGLFINAIPVRVAAPPRMEFSALVRSVRDAACAAEPHHYYPLPEIQARSGFGRDLFDHLLIFENFPLGTIHSGEADAKSPTMRAIGAHDETHYAFNLVVTPGERLHLKLSYNADLHCAEQIARIASHLQAAARVVVKHPERRLGEIDILPAAERMQVIAQFGRTGGMPNPDETVSSRIAASAARAPRAIALRDAETVVTYGEIRGQASAVAAALLARGVGRGSRVGVKLDRSPALLASLLGTWQAQAAFVPIDPQTPTPRIEEILRDSRCRVLLTDATCGRRPALPACCDVLDPHGLEADGEAAALTPAPSDIAYVIYTSGSTGTPKGCEITHRNLLNYLSWVTDVLHADGCSGSYSLFTSVAFDLTVTSLFTPLLLGRSLHLFPQEAELPDVLRAAFDGSRDIDTVKCTPTHIAALRQTGLACSPVRVCILGGEAVTREQTDYLHALNPGMQIWNEYGPTETTVGCIAAIVPPGTSRIVIGRPISNTWAVIKDRDGHPAPIGVAGEICIGGACVGNGYLFRPAATAERFIPDPTHAGSRSYRTGDLGRRLPDGSIEYLGRNDDQVKIRGHRVEPNEVQSALSRMAGVQEAAVIALPRAEETELVAYIVGDFEEEALRRQCREALPAHLWPAHIVRLPALPMTANGKLDRRRLPEPSGPSGGTTGMAPRTATQTALAAIWQSVLGQQRIGIRDNFFHLGGHSLKAIQALARTHEQFGRRISLRELFSHPTIEAVAELIDGQGLDAWQRIEPAPPRETYKLSDAQQRLWLADRMGAGHSLNISEAIAYRGHIDADVLERALRTVIERHESLRTAFVVANGEPRQKICPPPEVRLRRVDLRCEADPDRRAKEIADRDALEPFDLTQPTPLRAALLTLPGARGIFLLTTHHIIGDGWSSYVFFREITELYGAFTRGEPDPLPPLRVQYKDYAEWQTGRDFEREARYWTEQLEGVAEGVALAFDFPVPTTRRFLGASEAIDFAPEITAAVRQFAQARGTLVSYLLLALFELTLHRHTGQGDLCIGLSCANRNRPETEGLIGFFVNILPIRVQLRPEVDFADLLGEVVGRVTEAIEFQDYPLNRLIRTLNPPRRSNRPPLINVVYGFHDFLDLRFDLAGETSASSIADVVLTERPWTSAHETAKFDLTLLITDHGSHLHLTLEYDRSLFRQETARGYLLTLETLTRSVLQLSQPDAA